MPSSFSEGPSPESIKPQANRARGPNPIERAWFRGPVPLARMIGSAEESRRPSRARARGAIRVEGGTCAQSIPSRFNHSPLVFESVQNASARLALPLVGQEHRNAPPRIYPSVANRAGDREVKPHALLLRVTIG